MVAKTVSKTRESFEKASFSEGSSEGSSLLHDETIIAAIKRNGKMNLFERLTVFIKKINYRVGLIMPVSKTAGEIKTNGATLNYHCKNSQYHPAPGDEMLPDFLK